MEEIKEPKKERKFLKAVGNIAKALANELVMGIGRKFIGKAIDKVGNKKQGLSIVLIILASTFAFAQYPATGNKQRLGFQTTGDGLTWRGSISDTASIQPINNTSAWVILDTVNLKFYSFDFTSNVWNSVGGAAFEQPVDSLFFNTGVPTNNVETAKMRWDSDLATVVLGLNDNVPNELGFKNFWLVKNQTGSTITKGSIVYANGTVGASGRITIDKFIADGSIDAKYLLGITAHDLSNGEDGYVISFGKIRKVNTDTFAAGAILYPSPTVAGVWTDVEPIAPNIDMPIGFCINSHANNGTIAIRVASGYKLHELHDLAISSPIENASLYYKGGLWRDTTATLLVSDTASMLTNYLRTGTAASTYLPLTGGTLNANRNNTLTINSIATNVNPNIALIAEASSPFYSYTNIGVKGIGQTVYSSGIGLQGEATHTDVNAFGTAIGVSGIVSSSGAGTNGSTYAGYFNNTSTVGGNHYGLFVNTASGGDYGIYQTGSGINYLGSNTSIGGTLGVTGETTLSAPLTVNSSAVFNEGSTDSDFRVESDGNANMVFVDASTDRVGIGYASPTKTLDVNGEVRINTVTATPTSLLGKDGSNVVGELGLGTGMSIGSGILSVQAAGASATGLVTSFGSQTFGGNKTFNGTVTLKSATGTADSVIGRNSTGQIVNLTLGSGLSLSGGTLSASDNANSSLFISRTGTTVEFVEDLTIYSVIYLKLNNNSTITVTLPTASLTTNKSITIKNIGSGAVNSNASNVEPLNSSSLSSVILTSGGGKFTTLVSDGTNWIKMTGN
jgi:hypothetical protein